MLYPDLQVATIKPRSKLEGDLFASKSDPTACVAAYVSKMFAVPTKDLPENKKKEVTADEMRTMAREARAARLVEKESNDANSEPIVLHTAEYKPKGPQSAEAQNEGPDTEVVLGFARLYSGTLRVGTSVYAVLPKYNLDRDPTHPHNAKVLLEAQVEGLYVMMGRELVAVDIVRAGNIFAIKGLEGKVWRSATLCAPCESGIGDNPDLILLKSCLINLGAVNRSVR